MLLTLEFMPQSWSHISNYYHKVSLDYLMIELNMFKIKKSISLLT